MVGSRVSRPRRPLADQRRYTTGGNHFTRDSQHDPRWLGKEVARSLPARKQARRSIPHLESPPDSIRRRRAPLNPLLDPSPREEKFGGEDFWATRPTWRRKPKGKLACRES